jgi:hypothetical protein
MKIWDVVRCSPWPGCVPRPRSRQPCPAAELTRRPRLGFERLRVEQEVRPPVVSAVVLSLLRIRARGQEPFPCIAALSNGGGQSRVPAWHAGRQPFEPSLFNGFCMSAYPVTSKSGFLQEANYV